MYGEDWFIERSFRNDGMSLEERKRIYHEAKALERKGLIEESKRLMKKIPMNPEMANGFKQLFGLDRLRVIGFNFDDAVKMYGEEWLNS